MDYGIEGRVALVGGASQGIGYASAEALAREGARVAICARRSEVLAEAAAKIKEATGREVVAIEADLGEKQGVERALAETRDRLGEIAILVTNTGGPRPGKFGDLEEADWDSAYDLLLKSAIRLIGGVLGPMRKAGWGRIIGITSVSVREPIETLLLSNVFRSGVTSLFKSLARDVAADGVTLNTVLPGLTDTERLRGIYGAQAEARGQSTEEFVARVAKSVPMGRLSRAEELGEVVAFLASQAASAVTGSAVAVEGGQLRGIF